MIEILAGAVIGCVFAMVDDRAEKNRMAEIERIRLAQARRRSCTINYDEDITYEEFFSLVKYTANSISRITDATVERDSAMVQVSYRSQSGLSEYDFVVDYNDYGHITGRYWLARDDESVSGIPEIFADRLSDMIEKLCAYKAENDVQYLVCEENENTLVDMEDVETIHYCSRCGSRASETAFYCKHCGIRIR